MFCLILTIVKSATHVRQPTSSPGKNHYIQFKINLGLAFISWNNRLIMRIQNKLVSRL